MSSFWVWGKMDCLALPLPMSLCCLLSALLGTLPFPSVPPFPQSFISLEVLSVYFPVSPFTILIFPLCFKIFLSLPIDHISFSKPLPNLWMSSSPLLYLTSRLCVDLWIFICQSPLWRGFVFFFLQVVFGRMGSNEPDPLAWFVACVTDKTWPWKHMDNEMLQLSSFQPYCYLY